MMDRLQIATALIWHEERILIAQRRAGSHQGLKWEFPGGKVEAHETPEAAVLREVLEETGLEVKSLGERERIVHDYPDLCVELVVFDCIAPNRDASPLESNEVRWVMPADLPDYAFPAANRDLIQRLSQQPAPGL